MYSQYSTLLKLLNSDCCQIDEACHNLIKISCPEYSNCCVFSVYSADGFINIAYKQVVEALDGERSKALLAAIKNKQLQIVKQDLEQINLFLGNFN